MRWPQRSTRIAPDLVVLAGFMRILGADFVRRYDGRLLNIHPSLLPAFPGRHTHQRAIDAGCKLAGATVHFVTPSWTTGRSCCSRWCRCCPTTMPIRWPRVCCATEHRIYPLALRWFVEGQLRYRAGRGAACRR